MSIDIIRSVRVAGLAAFATVTLFADFSYQEDTRITGGALGAMMHNVGGQAPGATTSTVLVKGNRMAHIRPENTQVIDLDKETITNINFTKKTYTVMTFAQMKQMQEMVQKMGQQPSTGGEMNFKASVRETGQTKTVAGLKTSEKIMTLSMEGDKAPGAMIIKTDMWIAPDIPGYAEVRNFYRRMAEKSGGAQGALGPAMGARGMSAGMAAMAKEMSKLNGVPVVQVTSISDSGTAAPATAGAESGVTLEMTTESSGFSASPVDASKFEVPAGFQQVESNTMRRGRK